MPVQRAVIDTNVLVGALMRRLGQNRRVLRACFEDRVKPIVGHTLFMEYEDVLGRARLFKDCPLNGKERRQFLESFLHVCEWVQVYYLWRPNLPDEGDNHIVELAVASGATHLVTNNLSDFSRSELKFPGLRVVSPRDLEKELP